jgi:hypothetical protein
MQICLSRFSRFGVLIGLVALLALPARAVPVSLEITIDDEQGNVSVGSLDQSQLGCTDTSAVTATCNATNLAVGGLGITSLNLNLDTDPSIGSVIAVQNLTAATQRFTLTVILPIAPAIFAPSLTGGSVAGGATDNDGNGATLSSVAGSAMYAAIIDSVPYQFLYANPTILNVVNPFESADLPAAAFGVPIPSQIGPNALANIGIRYDFRLTAQDSASFTGVFVVQPIPEPATALLFGFGIAALARAGRRH